MGHYIPPPFTEKGISPLIRQGREQWRIHNKVVNEKTNETQRNAKCSVPYKNIRIRNEEDIIRKHNEKITFKRKDMRNHKVLIKI